MVVCQKATRGRPSLRPPNCKLQLKTQLQPRRVEHWGSPSWKVAWRSRADNPRTVRRNWKMAGLMPTGGREGLDLVLSCGLLPISRNFPLPPCPPPRTLRAMADNGHPREGVITAWGIVSVSEGMCTSTGNNEWNPLYLIRRTWPYVLKVKFLINTGVPFIFKYISEFSSSSLLWLTVLSTAVLQITPKFSVLKQQ